MNEDEEKLTEQTFQAIPSNQVVGYSGVICLSVAIIKMDNFLASTFRYIVWNSWQRFLAGEKLHLQFANRDVLLNIRLPVWGFYFQDDKVRFSMKRQIFSKER